MMTLQARESFSPINYPGRPLRAYPTDSPRAKARLVVLALLADGRMDAAELDGLAKNRAFAELGVTREDFFEVLYDFCADATGLPDGRGNYLLSPALLEALFAEVGSVAERQKLVRLIFDVIRSDGHLADGEARLFWQMTPEIMNHVSCSSITPFVSNQDFPTLVELVGLRLNLLKQSLDLLPCQLQIIGLLTLMRPNGSPLLLHLLQDSHFDW